MTLVLLSALVLAVSVAVALGILLLRCRSRHVSAPASGPASVQDSGPVAGHADAETDGAPAPGAPPSDIDGTTSPAVVASPEEDAAGATAVAETLWLLESARLERQWRLGAPGLEPPPSPSSPADGLVRSLALELDLLRDDVGVPGLLTLSLDEDLDEVTALLVLRTVQELLADLSRTVDEVDIRVSMETDRILVVVGYTADQSDAPPSQGGDGSADPDDPTRRLAGQLAAVGGVVRHEPGTVDISLPRIPSGH